MLVLGVGMSCKEGSKVHYLLCSIIEMDSQAVGFQIIGRYDLDAHSLSFTIVHRTGFFKTKKSTHLRMMVC